VLALAAALLAGCDRPQPTPPPASAPPASAPPPAAASAAPASAPQDDPYDVSKMDFKPGPAKLSSERHTGPFASGSALSVEFFSN